MCLVAGAHAAAQLSLLTTLFSVIFLPHLHLGRRSGMFAGSGRRDLRNGVAEAGLRGDDDGASLLCHVFQRAQVVVRRLRARPSLMWALASERFSELGISALVICRSVPTSAQRPNDNSHGCGRQYCVCGVGIGATATGCGQPSAMAPPQSGGQCAPCSRQEGRDRPV